MAYDKLVDSTQLDADLTSVANAIRTKGGTSADLAFPADFVTAIGNISGGGGGALKMGVIRPDAELVKAWTDDVYAVADEGVTIPAYSTTAQTLIAAANLNLSPSIELDTSVYDYFLLSRLLTTPVYSSAAGAKGKPIYCATAHCYEIVVIPKNYMQAGGKSYSTNSVANTTFSFSRMLYWSTATALGCYTSNTYGAFQSNPTLSFNPSSSTGKGTPTINSPALNLRGNTGYFTSSVWGTLTDVRRQYIIEMYRVPRGNNNLHGWSLWSTAKHVIDCAQGTGKLT